MLFHGSRACNWVGILSRGLLLPKIVVSLGVNRTGKIYFLFSLFSRYILCSFTCKDGGWLGDGIYFGEADTAAGYAQAGDQNTAFFLCANVALGKMKEYSKITYGLEIPKSFQSAYGNPKLGNSQFHDNEFVIYDERQHRMEYLVEFDKGSWGW